MSKLWRYWTFDDPDIEHEYWQRWRESCYALGTALLFVFILLVATLIGVALVDVAAHAAEPQGAGGQLALLDLDGDGTEERIHIRVTVAARVNAKDYEAAPTSDITIYVEQGGERAIAGRFKDVKRFEHYALTFTASSTGVKRATLLFDVDGDWWAMQPDGVNDGMWTTLRVPALLAAFMVGATR